jgi:hypothetical protein
MIDVSSIDELISKGFIIKAFSNGGLIIRCADYGRNECNTSLSPYFDNEVLKMHISVKLGEYIKTESIGIMESSEPSKRKSSSADTETKSMDERPRQYYPPASARSKTLPLPTQPRLWQNEEKGSASRNPEPNRIYYPLVYKGS